MDCFEQSVNSSFFHTVRVQFWWVTLFCRCAILLFLRIFRPKMHKCKKWQIWGMIEWQLFEKWIKTNFLPIHLFSQSTPPSKIWSQCTWKKCTKGRFSPAHLPLSFEVCLGLLCSFVDAVIDWTPIIETLVVLEAARDDSCKLHRGFINWWTEANIPLQGKQVLLSVWLQLILYWTRDNEDLLSLF